MKILKFSVVIAITILFITFASTHKLGNQATNTSESPSRMRGTSIASASEGNTGYTAAFKEEIQNIGQISSQEFIQLYPNDSEYLTRITWDPKTAEFWDKFNTDPAIHTQDSKQHKRNYDFSLDQEEYSAFSQNGFVVSERLGAQSFAEMFYRIFTNDLPVFVSTDSILHAWHRSYDKALQELEEVYLAPSLKVLLDQMAAEIPLQWDQYDNDISGPSIIDSDYFLAVARSLLNGNLVETHLNQTDRVKDTLTAIESQQVQEFDLFGRSRKVDFSQFKVRGHYENSEQLKQYFKAMMWCGRIDFRIAGDSKESSTRELGGAIVLLDLLKQSDQFENWQDFDRLLQTFVGVVDSMTFEQLNTLLTQADVNSLADISSLSILEDLQNAVLKGSFGNQEIVSHIYKSPNELDKSVLPKSFTLLGQRFSTDSWAMSKVVYDQIEWNDEKVKRHLPSALDIAFSVFGNNQVVSNLVSRIQDKNGHALRDGLNYQHNLAAIRNVIDRQEEGAWKESIYANWLATLRTLSQPTTDPKYPESMRTRAWAMKTVNSQLASWTQLRHDTILYNKQSYGRLLCSYPAGFVEPHTKFWESFETLVAQTIGLLENTPFPEVISLLDDTVMTRAEYERRISEQLESENQDSGKVRAIDNSFIFPQSTQEKQIAFFKQFLEDLKTLKLISVKELAQEPLTDMETQFLKNIVEIEKDYVGQIEYRGWYPRLFYGGPEDSTGWDAIVADVHTNLNQEGSVLHEGIGNVDMMMIAVDNGEDKMIYAGPTLSHYEFEMNSFTRLTDSDWKQLLQEGNLPSRPNWTEGYLITGNNPDTQSYPRPVGEWFEGQRIKR